MSTQPPFRMPCEAVAGQPVIYLGSPFSHALAPDLRDKYVNNTTVPNWNTDVGGVIPPYERFHPSDGGTLSCASWFCDPAGAPCVAWPLPAIVNTYTHTPSDQINFALARLRGFKNVHARRYWSGVPGYGVSRDGGLDTVQCCGSGTLKKWNGYQSVIRGTKFLTVAISSEYKLTDFTYDGSGNPTGSSVAFDDTSAVSQSINPTSGLLSFSGFSVAPNSSSNHSLSQLAFAFWTPSQIVELCTTPYLDGTPFSTTSCTDNSITVLDSGGKIIETLVWDLTAGTFEHKTYSWDGAGNQFLTEDVTLSFSDAGLFYSDTVNTYGGSGPLGSTVILSKVEDTMNATLGGSNTSASIYADIKTLLGLWPLNDNALYPYRTDRKVSAAPLVSRDEVLTTAFTADFYTVNGDGTLSLNTADTRVATGAIKGAPNPAGYQNYFDSTYNDWAGCCYTDLGSGKHIWSWYQVGWGMDVATFNTASGAQLPLNATQWSNYFQMINKPAGAFLFYNDPRQDYWAIGCHSSDDAPSGVLDGGALWGGKWVEIADTWPSENLAMPAGDAKFWFDETRVYCATVVDSTHVTLTNTLDGTTPPNGTDFSGIWGGSVVGGFYNVTSYASGTLTLGSKVWSVPSNWASKSNGDESACFGLLRWSSRPSLLGRVGITPDMAGTTMTFAADQPAFGMSIVGTEQVDLYDKDMTLLASNLTATRINNSSFGPLAFGYPTARFVTITGQKWYMNDKGAKGDYAFLQWWSDLRSYGEYLRLTGVLDCASAQVARPTANTGGGPLSANTQFAAFTQTPGCIPFSPCAPKIICISPNGEEFPNGITYDFPATFACDEQYGSKWWAFAQLNMTDLFWQAPHRPCNIDPLDQWKEDDGTCQPNDLDATPAIYYFGHRPQVEALLSVPCKYGAAQNECPPALPAGIQVGWLSPVHYDSGDVALPPAAAGANDDHGEPADADAAWALHAIFCAHSAGCRFDYQLPGC